jgi:hypothetical protein
MSPTSAPEPAVLLPVRGARRPRLPLVDRLPASPRLRLRDDPDDGRQRRLTYDPVELARAGQVTGLSKADRQAILDGADFGKVVNVRARAAGLKESGVVLLRAGRMTPEAIYRVADGDRTRALDLLAKHGYVR